MDFRRWETMCGAAHPSMAASRPPKDEGEGYAPYRYSRFRYSPFARSHKRLDARLRPAENQRMNVVGAFVGVDGFEIAQHAHHMKLIGNAVAAVHVAGEPRHFQSLAAIVALEQRDRRRRYLALLDQPGQPQHRMQAERDFGLHVG